MNSNPTTPTTTTPDGFRLTIHDRIAMAERRLLRATTRNETVAAMNRIAELGATLRRAVVR